jgi:hypothetical protein
MNPALWIAAAAIAQTMVHTSQLRHADAPAGSPASQISQAQGGRICKQIRNTIPVTQAEVDRDPARYDFLMLWDFAQCTIYRYDSTRSLILYKDTPK